PATAIASAGPDKPAPAAGSTERRFRPGPLLPPGADHAAASAARPAKKGWAAGAADATTTTVTPAQKTPQSCRPASTAPAGIHATPVSSAISHAGSDGRKTTPSAASSN